MPPISTKRGVDRSEAAEALLPLASTPAPVVGHFRSPCWAKEAGTTGGPRSNSGPRTSSSSSSTIPLPTKSRALLLWVGRRLRSCEWLLLSPVCFAVIPGCAETPGEGAPRTVGSLCLGSGAPQSLLMAAEGEMEGRLRPLLDGVFDRPRSLVRSCSAPCLPARSGPPSLSAPLPLPLPLSLSLFSSPSRPISPPLCLLPGVLLASPSPLLGLAERELFPRVLFSEDSLRGVLALLLLLAVGGPSAEPVPLPAPEKRAEAVAPHPPAPTPAPAPRCRRPGDLEVIVGLGCLRCRCRELSRSSGATRLHVPAYWALTRPRAAQTSDASSKRLEPGVGPELAPLRRIRYMPSS